MKRKKIDAVDNTSPAQTFTLLTYNARVCIMVTEQADGFEKLVRVVSERGDTLWQIRRQGLTKRAGRGIMVFYLFTVFKEFEMSYKVYNFRYARGTKPGSVREVLVASENDSGLQIAGYDRLADSREGGYRIFDRKAMSDVTVYEAKVIRCLDDKSAEELAKLGMYDTFGNDVLVSKKMVPRKPEPKVELRGRVDKGYVKLTYGSASVDLPLTGGKGAGYVYAGSNQSTFESVIITLYNEIQKNKK